MTAYSNTKQRTWKISVALFAIFSVIFTYDFSLVLAEPPGDTELQTRNDMMNIADAHAQYLWQDTATNILHLDPVFTCRSEELCEQDHSTLKEIWNGASWGTFPIEVNGKESVMKTYPIDTPEWIEASEIENEGIPYSWGQSSGLGYAGTLSFNELLTRKYFTGNTNTLTPFGNSYAAGVDCIGYVNNVWRMGSRIGMDNAQKMTRPIRFKDLRAGDVLMHYVFGNDRGSHVMIFKEWVNFSGGEPIPGETRFLVYEAAGDPFWKVVENEYLLLATTPIIPDPDDESRNTDPEVSFRDEQQYSDRITMQRITDGVTLDGDYIPRTYLSPISVVLVIDKSGSMSELMQAKIATAVFIGSMKPGDKLGIISFNGSADYVYPPAPTPTLIEIGRDGIEKNDAINAIFGLSEGGSTSINAGLQKGEEQLMRTKESYSPGEAFMILMSDGWTGDNLDARLVSIKGHNIAVHALGIGPNANNALLRHIADETGGTYFDAQNSFLYSYMHSLFAEHTLNKKTYFETTIASTTGAIPAGGTANETVLADSTMGTMNISLIPSENNLTLSLIQPDGNPIDINDPNVSLVSGSTYAFYTIRSPQPGEWTMRVSGATGDEYALSVSTMDAMNFSVDVDKEEYYPSDPIKFTTSIIDSTSVTGTSTTNPAYIYDATIEVTAENPDLSQSAFTLNDEGLDGDETPDDGIYTGTFSDTSLEGYYNFELQISGNNNRADQPFTREERLSVIVNVPPSVESITRASANPTSYFNVDYTIIFSEPVTGVDISDFVLTTDGLTDAEISEVSGENNIYTVSVNTGNGNGTLRLDVVDDDSIIDEYAFKLVGIDLGNGNFTGETYDIEDEVLIVSKLDNTDDGLCDADCSLEEAIASAISDDTITFDASLAGSTIHIASALTLSRNIMIDGSALAVPIAISGDSDNNGTKDTRVFTVNADVVATLKNLTITMSMDSGIRSEGTLSVANTTFLNNSSTFGSGIYNQGGTLTVTNSTFSDNHADNEGGGIYNGDEGVLTIVNSTFSGNSALYRGGGISNGSGGILTIINSTLSGNYARSEPPSSYAGGIVNYLGTLNYANTIIANSASGEDCINTGSIGTNINNLVEDGSSSCSASLSGDPNLGELADNGGPTQTMALLSGSPAIDTGDDTTCADAPVSNKDQRGEIRPQGAHCDIGAYETGENPTEAWNTFLGGSDDDKNYGMVADGNGNYYISGHSSACWGSPVQAYSSSSDGFVAKVNAFGTVIWNTFLGGSGWDIIKNITIDNAGNIYVVGGSTASWGNPLGAFIGSQDDVFVAKLDPSGTLLWHTFLGGTGLDQGKGITVDGSGNIYVNGNSPVSWGDPVNAHFGSQDVMVVKLNSSGALLWNTFLGGNGDDYGYGVTLDDNENIYITGFSNTSWESGSPIVEYTGAIDAFVAKLDNSNGTLLWNTFLGGSNGRDVGYDIGVDDGNIYVTGHSTATWGDPVQAYNAEQDGILVQLDTSGVLLWHTFFGGAGTDYGYRLDIDGNGSIYVGGGSNATWGNPDQSYNGNYDAIVVKLNSTGGLLATTFLGGNEEDKGYSIALGENGNIYLSGRSATTWGNPLRAYTSGNDVFVAKLNVDSAPLIVASVTRADDNPTSASSVVFTLTFSEDVTGVNTTSPFDDFTLTTTGVSGASITAVNCSGTTCTVTVDTGYGNGTIRLDLIDDDSIVDFTGNPLGGSGAGNGDYTSGEEYIIEKSDQPINDDFDNAIDVAVQDQITLDTRGATSSASDPVLPDQCGIDSNNKKGQATVWYKYYLENDDAISVDTLGSGYDTFIAIWEGTDINDLRFVACNNDTGGTKQSAVAIRVTGGKTYYIEIGQP